MEMGVVVVMVNIVIVIVGNILVMVGVFKNVIEVGRFVYFLGFGCVFDRGVLVLLLLIGFFED